MTPTPLARTMLRCVVLLLGLGLAALVAAQEAPGSLLRIPTRDGVHATLFWQPAPLLVEDGAGAGVRGQRRRGQPTVDLDRRSLRQLGGEFAFLVRAEPDRRRGLIEQLVTENALDVDYARAGKMNLAWMLASVLWLNTPVKRPL